MLNTWPIRPQATYASPHSGAETPQEFIDAYNDLLDKGMKNLIIDLQDNGGGYLSASVDIAKHFLPSGSTIVYTEGLRQEPQFFFADSRKPALTPRIVVLANEYSASASEILSGALQDNDRGLVIGRRTFGKGLRAAAVPVSRRIHDPAYHRPLLHPFRPQHPEAIRQRRHRIIRQ